MQAGAKGGAAHLIMLMGPGKVQNELHLRVRKEPVHIVIDLFDPVLFRGAQGLFLNKVAQGDDFKPPEGLRDVFEVDPADVADADDPYFHHGRRPL